MLFTYANMFIFLLDIFSMLFLQHPSIIVGSVVEWLKRRTDDQHGLGSKPTCAILLCPWETLRLFPCLVVLTSSSKL